MSQQKGLMDVFLKNPMYQEMLNFDLPAAMPFYFLGQPKVFIEMLGKQQEFVMKIMTDTFKWQIQEAEKWMKLALSPLSTLSSEKGYPIAMPMMPFVQSRYT